MKKLLDSLFKKERKLGGPKKQNAHHVKSKRHWDWDTGYSDLDIMNDPAHKNDKK